MSRSPVAHPVVILLAGTIFTIGLLGRHHTPVALEDAGTKPPNSCVPTACVEFAKHRYARLLFVRYQGSDFGHCYCVWWQDGNTYGYDWRGPVVLLGIHTNPNVIARALPVPEDGLVVESAAFNNYDPN